MISWRTRTVTSLTIDFCRSVVTVASRNRIRIAAVAWSGDGPAEEHLADVAAGKHVGRRGLRTEASCDHHVGPVGRVQRVQCALLNEQDRLAGSRQRGYLLGEHGLACDRREARRGLI